MAIAPSGTPVLSNSGASTATTMTATLASTTPGALNIIAVSANTTGTGTDPAQTVAGFTAVLGTAGTSGKTGTPYHRLSLFYRFFVAGDTNPTVTIAALGNIECAAVAYAGVDAGAPFVTGEVLAQPQGASSTSWSTGAITTAALRWIISVFGNRTNGTWSALTDTLRVTGIIASSANIAYQDTNGAVAAGTVAARTATFSASTSVGNTVIMALNPTVAVTSSRATTWAVATTTTPVTKTSATTWAVASALTAVSKTAVTTWTATAAVSASRATTWTARSRLSEWLAATPLYVVHRLGDNDWVEHTRYAGTQAIANGATAVNIDAVRCSTGEFVASHNLTTGAVFGTNYTIGSTSWSTLSPLTTTNGGYPIEKVADLLAAFPNVVVFVENKGNSSDDTALLDMLDAAGGKARIVIKQYYTAATVATDAHARGYTTWGYYYAADLTNLAATHSRWDLLGLDYLDTSSTDWTTIKALGKPVLGHVIPSAAAAAQAFSEGADGIMTGKVLGVIPGTPAPVTASRATTWAAKASVSGSRASTWNTAGIAASTRATTWGVLTPANAGRPTTWQAAAGVAGQRVTTFTTLAAVPATRATSWAVATPVTSNAASSWVTAAAVTATRLTGWQASAAVSVIRPTNWAAFTVAAVSRATTWAAPGRVTTGRATTWGSSSQLATSRPGVWAVLATVNASRASTWAASGQVAAARATNWATSGALSTITTNRATAWAVVGSVFSARTATWAALHATTASNTATWACNGTAQGGRPTSWTVRAQVAVVRATAWTTSYAITASTGTAWPVGAVVAGSRGSSWAVLAVAAGGRSTSWTALVGIERAALTSWAVSAPTSAARTTGWHTALAVTAGRVLVWTVTGQPASSLAGQLSVRLGPARWACQLGPSRWAVRLGVVDVRASTTVLVPVQVKAPVALGDAQLRFCTNTTDEVPASPVWQPLVVPAGTVWRPGEWVTLLAPVGPGLPVGSLYIIPRITTADEDFREVAGYRQVRA